MKLPFLLLVPLPVWLLIGALAVVGTVHAVERETDMPYAACDARDEPPLYRADLAPGERVMVGDVMVTADTNVSQPFPAGAIRVVLCGTTLLVTVPEGFSVGMGSPDGGLAGNCGNVGGRSRVSRCDVRAGSSVRVSALMVTQATPVP